jgi:hypothetical protein
MRANSASGKLGSVTVVAASPSASANADDSDVTSTHVCT